MADPTPGTRSGALNGVLWGVSRATSAASVYNWADSIQNRCGTNVQVGATNDVNICDGHLVESVNDNGGQTVLAMYPRQPFNFAGRTGTIEFDVSDNTQGLHAAWPTLVITDQPVPAPGGDQSALMDNARNSVGIDFDVLESNNPSCLTAAVWDTADYVFNQEPTHQDSCVNTSPGPGVMNHVEVQINSSGVKVYMSQPGNPTSTTLVADSNFAVPLNQGLVWLEDQHYNGGKFNTQQTNTFTWANIAFDGPLEPRDLAFDVLDNTTSGPTAENGLPTTNIGYQIGHPTEWPPPGSPGAPPLTLNLSVPNVTGVSDAFGALLCLSYWAESAENLTYSVNGNSPQVFDWPYAHDTNSMVGPTYVSQSVCMPVPLNQVHNGTNTIALTTSDTNSGVATANYDLILQGAGGLQSSGGGIVPQGLRPASGYRLVASDGGIFSYGDAGFYGSTGNIHLNKPIVGMAATPDGGGYWLVASDGGIFSYGDGTYYGSMGGQTLSDTVVGVAGS